ncbi:conserved hypothetical protein [Ricinus communis]|uniref:Uncharacterized protein n=1 Tax=Ricinus communis TaxID=3988 RepID=B9RSJ2_RICCO|nr:conserved hypothetical protein [Ricinus communis]
MENNSMAIPLIIKIANKTRPPLYVKFMVNSTTLLSNVGVASITPFNWRTNSTRLW